MKVKTKYDIGNRVRLVSDDDRKVRVITAILIKSQTHHEYNLSCGVDVSWHTEPEIDCIKPTPIAGFKIGK